jgi:hypothetical protein
MTTSGPKKCDNASCPQPDSAPATLLLCSRCRTTRYCSQACQAASWPPHKKQCRRQNYIIKFRLAPDHISDPPVERTLSCPANAPFYALHLALQTAFGWATTHSFDFAVKDPVYTPPTDVLEYMQQIRQFQEHNSGPGGPGTGSGGMHPASGPREYLLRVTDPVPQSRFSGIDRAHEGQRRHPSTVEKKSDKWSLWQLLEKEQYQGALVPVQFSLMHDSLPRGAAVLCRPNQAYAD